MKYNILGNTGLRVSELCLGTMTFGGTGYWAAIGQLGQESADQIIKSAIDSGINFIDTANVYGFGNSESITGQAIKNLGLNRDDLVIATKVRGAMDALPNSSGLSKKHIFSQIDQSLKRLQTDYIDLYQIHGFDELTPLEETMDALDLLVKSGKVRYVGCSNLSAWHIVKANYYAKYNYKTRFESLQAYYTLAGRDLEREIIPMLKDQNIGLMVWSPLAGGFLSGKFKKDSETIDARRSKFDFPPIDKEKAYDIIDLLEKISIEKNASIAQLALAWLLHQKVVTTVIIGVKNQNQFEDNLKSIEISFTEDEISAINQISALNKEYPEWMFERQRGDRIKS